MKRLLLFCFISWGCLVFLGGVESVAQQISTEPVPPGQQSISEIKKQKEALKQWKEADALYIKNAKPNDRQKALQIWEDIGKIPPSETSPFLNQLILNAALNTGQFAAARKALIASGLVPPESQVFRTENLQKLVWESPPASSAVRIDKYLSAKSTTPAGSGTVITEDGWILTAAHVVARLEKPIVVFADGSAFAVEYVHPGNFRSDLALIKVDKKWPGYARMASVSPSLGESVHSVGFPGGSLFPIKSSGQLKKFSQLMGQNTVATTLSAFPGSSGGGVFNEKDELVGVMSMVSYEKVGTSNGQTLVALYDDVRLLIESIKETKPSPLSERDGWAEKYSIWTNKSLGVELYFQATQIYLTDPSKGLELLKEAHEEGSARAAYSLGYILLQRPNRSTEDAQTAFEYFDEASESDAECLAAKGYLRMEGIGTKQDSTKAMEDLVKAAERGSLGAKVTMASCRLNGNRVPFNYAKAMALIEDPINKGVKSAYGIKLFGLFSNIMSPGSEKPPQEAFNDYFSAKNFSAVNIPKEKANQFFEFCVIARSNEAPFSGYLQAVCYLEGIGTEKDFSKAILIFEEEGNKGEALSAFKLGKLYFPQSREGAPEDFDKSIYWYGKAADQGDPGAKLLSAVGEMAKLERIKNQEKSAKPSQLSERSVIFLTDAANTEVPQVAPAAQYFLGLHYLRGDYLPKDLPKAVHFFGMAKANGVAQAAASLIEAKNELEHSK